MCQFGCIDVVESNRIDVYKHFYNCHSASELKKWGINKDIIAEGLKDEHGQKQIKHSTKAITLQERNAYGLCPVSGTQRVTTEIPIREKIAKKVR